MESKKIISLNDFEHVLQRPTIYIGSVEKSDEKLPIVENGQIVLKEKSISIGFYKLLHEILDNAFDEAKRINGKMKSISVEVFSSGRVIISDTGDGFYLGYEKNEKTGLSNVETAMSQLRSGSNFKNEKSKENLIGTNGVGASLVNMLSDSFEITTCDGNKCYRHRWEKFQTTLKTIKKSTKKGTSVDFTPRKDVFKDCLWDKEILHSELIFKNYIKNLDPLLKNLKFTVKFDNELLDLNVPFFSNDNMVDVDSKIGKILILPSFKNSTKLSFINGQMCSGIHQKIIQDYVNGIIKDEKAHEFYDSIIILNLEPNLIVFGDQNKTRFTTTRNTIEPVIDQYFKSKLRKELVGSSLIKQIKELIKERDFGDASRKVSQISKKKKIVLSNKYFPASGKKEYIFLVEGQSALGSLNQRRDPKTMGTYALKGKIKNVKDLKDLSSNKEVSELIQIIGLDLKDSTKLQYENIVIAVDADGDGAHISSLVINLLYRWFPYMIRENRVFLLRTPIVTGEIGKTVKRFYTLDEYYKIGKKLNNIRYLKGLGSLSIPDWEYTFQNLNNCLIKVEEDKDSQQSIDLAFSDFVEHRKIWLTS